MLQDSRELSIFLYKDLSFLLTESMSLHIVNDGLISINNSERTDNPFLVKEDFYRFYIRRQPRGQIITTNSRSLHKQQSNENAA